MAANNYKKHPAKDPKRTERVIAAITDVIVELKIQQKSADLNSNKPTTASGASSSLVSSTTAPEPHTAPTAAPTGAHTAANSPTVALRPTGGAIMATKIGVLSKLITQPQDIISQA